MVLEQYSFYDRFVPFVHKQNDPFGALKAIVDGFEQEIFSLRELAIALPTLLDLDQAPCDFLPYLANHIGLEVEACDPCDLIREQIRSAVPIYRVKGTIQSFEAIFRTLGFNATVIPLFEDGPDSGNVLDESDAITGFNTRAPGFNMSSRIRLELEILPEAEDLEICGFEGGVISNFLLQRLLKKLKTVLPIHIEVSTIVLIEFTDSITINDELALQINALSGLAVGCCCYYGKFARIENPGAGNKYNTGLLYNTGILYNSFGGFSTYCKPENGFYNQNYSFENQYSQWVYNPVCPRLWGTYCTYGEENAFSLDYHGWEKTDGSSWDDLSVSTGSDIVTSPSSLFLSFQKIEVGDFVRILGEEEWRIIIDIPSDTSLQIASPFPAGINGVYSFEIHWVKSWHQRQAVYKDPFDFSLPQYYYRVEPTVLNLFDTGLLFDDGNLFDVTGLKYDCCDYETLVEDDGTTEEIIYPCDEIIAGSEGILKLPAPY